MCAAVTRQGRLLPLSASAISVPKFGGGSGSPTRQSRRLQYVNFNAEDDTAEVALDDRGEISEIWLSGRRVPFKRIFYHKQAEEFRTSVDVRLDLTVSLKRAARQIATAADNCTPEHDGIGRQVEVLASAHSREFPFTKQLRVDPADDHTRVRKEVLERDFKKDDNRFVNFRHRRVIYGEAGPVVWYELVDAVSEAVLAWAPSHDPVAECDNDSPEGVTAAGQGEGMRLVAELRHTFEVRRANCCAAILLMD